MHDQILIDIIILLSLVIMFTLLLTIKKIHDLLLLDYKLHDTAVPDIVTQMVQAAENNYYSQNKTSQAIEAIQDILAIIAPKIVYRFNFSVGRMRMKPKTMESILLWSVKHKMLTINTRNAPELTYLLAYLAMIPNACRWQAEVYLSKLKSEHPQLSKMDWSEIADDPSLIAKLYSGYMGAGGDWGGWKKTLVPGKEAQRRFKYDADKNTYHLYEDLS